MAYKIYMFFICSVISNSRINTAIQYYGSLSDDWDHEGSSAPSKIDIENAEKFVQLIFGLNIQLPSVFLSKDGEINFIWNSSDSPTYIDIGFIDGTYSAYAVDANNEKILKNEEQYNKDDLICLLSILNYEIKSL